MRRLTLDGNMAYSSELGGGVTNFGLRLKIKFLPSAWLEEVQYRIGGEKIVLNGLTERRGTIKKAMSTQMVMCRRRLPLKRSSLALT